MATAEKTVEEAVENGKKAHQKASEKKRMLPQNQKKKQQKPSGEKRKTKTTMSTSGPQAKKRRVIQNRGPERKKKGKTDSDIEFDEEEDVVTDEWRALKTKEDRVAYLTNWAKSLNLQCTSCVQQPVPTPNKGTF